MDGKNLARLIREGLKLAEDDYLTHGVDIGVGPEAGKVKASVIGLALIGKVGLERALDLSRLAFLVESYSKEGTRSAKREICEELDITWEELEALHGEHFMNPVTALDLASKLEMGTLRLRTFPHRG